jgi:translation initiation factor 2 subunit 1
VKQVTTFAAWCDLDEYDTKGMVHISEVAGKWVYDIREFAKEGKQYVAKVVRIDEAKNLVNLSLKRVSKKEAKNKINSHRKEQRAEKILEIAAKGLNKSLNQAYEEVGYSLQENFGNMFKGLEQIKGFPEEASKIGISDEWNKALQKILEKEFKEKEIFIKVDLELKSHASDGVERVKKVLESLTNNNPEATITYISAPKYRIVLETKEPKIAEKKLKENLELAMKQIKDLEGEGSYRFVK